MEKFELHNKIIQQLRFHRISGMDEEQCADNILSIVQTDWTEGCLCYEGDKTGETWCCNKCGKPTSTHTSHHPTLPSDEEIEKSLKYNSALQFDKERECALIGAKWMRSICEAKIAEMEREMKEAKQFISDVMNFADGIKVLDGEALQVLKNTARRVLSDKPTQFPRK